MTINPHEDLIRKVISPKLFLDTVPSSFVGNAATRVA